MFAIADKCTRNGARRSPRNGTADLYCRHGNPCYFTPIASRSSRLYDPGCHCRHTEITYDADSQKDHIDRVRCIGKKKRAIR